MKYPYGIVIPALEDRDEQDDERCAYYHYRREISGYAVAAGEIKTSKYGAIDVITLAIPPEDSGLVEGSIECEYVRIVYVSTMAKLVDWLEVIERHDEAPYITLTCVGESILGGDSARKGMNIKDVRWSFGGPRKKIDLLPKCPRE